MNASTCRSCGADIAFLMLVGGRKMPVDLPGERRIVRADPMSPDYSIQMTYVSHFATCPNAAEHRRGG